MLRQLSIMTALVVFSGTCLAAQITGPVVKVDAVKNQLTLTIDGKDQTFDIKKGAKVYTLGRKKMEMTITLSEVKPGAQVTGNVEKEGDKNVLTFVKVEQQKKKKKK